MAGAIINNRWWCEESIGKNGSVYKELVVESNRLEEELVGNLKEATDKDTTLHLFNSFLKNITILRFVRQ